ncbi:MAG: AtpZ/AtpI family protein [Nitrospirae bacterium]|nr:AtpZ/AtpI family protein [Nitrospirota bacterium]
METDPGRESKNEKQKTGDLWRFVGVASTVGINMVVSTFVGFALGYWVLDKYLDTAPWFTIILTFLGIVAGFRYLFKIAQKAGEKDDN